MEENSKSQATIFNFFPPYEGHIKVFVRIQWSGQMMQCIAFILTILMLTDSISLRAQRPLRDNFLAVTGKTQIANLNFQFPSYDIILNVYTIDK